MNSAHFHATHNKSYNVFFETHMHDHYELYLVLSDNVMVETEHGVYNAGHGDIFVFAPFCFHKIAASNMNYERCLMQFDEQYIIKAASCLQPAFVFLKQSNHMHFKADRAATQKMVEIFDKCAVYAKSDDCFRDFNIITQVGEFIKMLTLLPEGDDIAALPQNRISVILKYVHDNAREGLTVSDVCSKFNIGTTTLHKMFRTNLDMSPGEYILRIKLMHAANLLKDGKTVTEAANLSGFNSYSHFIRIFKNRMGLPPHKYTNQQ
ncbi:MAG: AraC family transcriptional regulator [Clostridia bacterium]|nr:AraC family transcriptional regulator [Clostridia bacterium]